MKFVIAFLLTLTAVSGGFLEDEESRLALQNPDLFQGDILGYDPDDRNVIPGDAKRWTNKIIPYVIDSPLAKSTSLIRSAMEEYHKHTCIRFVPRTNQKNYIKIYIGKGCTSYIGMLNRGEQLVSLGNGCLNLGIIVHELGHAVGFFHEQNRSDRDDYVNIFWDNIQKGKESQFRLLRPDQNILMTPFDHESIMLYGNYAFSKDRSLKLKTMESKNGKPLLEPYERKGLSKSDIVRVKRMYKC